MAQGTISKVMQGTANTAKWVRINLFILSGIVCGIYLVDAIKEAGSGALQDPIKGMWLSFFAGLWISRFRK